MRISILATPEPAGHLHVALTEIALGTVLHRVHLSEYQADQFNPGVRGNARFSPIQDEKGKAIPTLYAGTILPCALMETVFHDVPHTAGFKSFDKAKLNGQVHSTVRLEAALQVVDLSSVPLRKQRQKAGSEIRARSNLGCHLRCSVAQRLQSE
ncbi:RES family NAD+ phosphorylase [Pseudomonas sp. 102515]|uniref:RES family NAD+ phosphorylase n=1 Tax=Pseudomonas sp. 102515 TaxID=3071568 RepID=UPI002801EC63|nr:RES family NAD+ phosphorylase [Pseudomonas sp. 102515]MDQ7911673.1 RES family NAD+ phosphorylase [Pseudomonas sp. 102515]